MSGGSYEYLCFAKFDELIIKTSEIQRMADRLAGLGYASDAAKETQELLLTILQYENRINVMHERIAGVWRAVEWWDSGDAKEDILKSALEEYRKATKSELSGI